MNILFLMLNYPYEKSRGHMYKDLSRKFAEEGHRVYVVALLESKYGKDTHIEEEENHTILWIKAGNYFGVNKIRKGITAVLLPFYFNKYINRFLKDKKMDLVIYPTPAVTFYNTVKKLKAKYSNAKYLLVVKDIFPQNALDLGIMKKNFVYKYFRRIEKNIYEASDYLGCMSNRNIEYLMEHNNIKREKLFILENWSSSMENTPLSTARRNELIKKYSLEGKFTLTFGGTIGPTNELEFLVELAKKVEKNEIDDVQFNVIGRGIRKRFIEQLVKENNLTNVKIFDFVPTNEYDDLLKLSDVGLINLNRNFNVPNIPSKSLNLMRIGKPILAATNESTDYCELIENTAKCGLWCETGDLDKYYSNLRELKSNEKLRNEMALNARKYFERNLTTQVAYENIIEKIGEIDD